MFERILVATDGSAHADVALDAGIEIAKRFGSELTLVAVVPIRVGFVEGPVALPPATEDDLTAYRQVLARAEARARAAGLSKVTTACLEGYVIDALLGYMEKNPPDLLLVGARGLSTAQRILLGSTSEGLLHHAPCPVLVTRPPKAAGAPKRR